MGEQVWNTLVLRCALTWMPRKYLTMPQGDFESLIPLMCEVTALRVALDSLTVGVILVSSGLDVHFANA